MFFFSVVVSFLAFALALGATFLAFALALGAAFLASALIRKAPIPPFPVGLGPLSPPIPAIFPCFASSVGPLLIGMIMGANADTCVATRRMAARMHLTIGEEDIVDEFAVQLRSK